jgi:hypothetical protein
LNDLARFGCVEPEICSSLHAGGCELKDAADTPDVYIEI